MESIPALQFTGLRFLLSYLFIEVCFLLRKRKGKTKKDAIPATSTLSRFHLLVPFCLFSTIAFQALSLENITPALCSIITSFSVIFVGVFEYFGSRRSKSSVNVPILIGSVLLTTMSLSISSLHFLGVGQTLDLKFLYGVSCSVIGALFFALYLVLQARYAHHDKRPTDRIVKEKFLVVASLSFLGLLISEQKSPWHLIGSFEYKALISLIQVSILSTCLAFVLIVKYQAKLSPSGVAIIFSLEPSFATLFSIVQGKDYFSWCLLVGLFLTTAAIFLNSKSSNLAKE